MAKQEKKNKKQQIDHEIQYVEFLKKRLSSNNFLQNESQEVIEKTKLKYKKAKLILRMLEKSTREGAREA